MPQRFRPSSLALAVVTVALSLAPPLAHAEDAPVQSLADGEKGPEGKVPACVKVSTQARYSGLGYDHLVDIENTCDKPMSCTVATDVNKEPTTVKVAAKQTETVVTFRGSPAREFNADVSCKEAS
jgi:hypothetical protein